MTTYSRSQNVSSAVTSKKESIVLLSFALALIRTALAVVSAFALGTMTKLFFPELAIATPVTALMLVFADTLVVVYGLLYLRTRATARRNK